MVETHEHGPVTDLQGSGAMSPPLWDRLVCELELRDARRLADPEADLPAIMLDRFVILRCVGEGGMGIVFEGHDSDLGRRVAIKACKATSRETARLIEHEARSLAKLAHPNIVSVFEILRYGADVALVMEFVEGQTLRKWQANTRPSWRDVLACYVEAGGALAAVHAAGLEHADFKPDNILIDHEGRVRVVDFGLALHSSPTGEAGEFANVGTREYMPPERLMDEPGGPRADIYSFCVSVWESLYGVRPYGAPRHRSASALLEAIELGEPAIARPLPGLPERIRDVLAKGLAAAPSQRYASIEEVLRALLDVVREDQRSHEQRASRRRRWRWGLLAVLVAVVIGCGGYLLARAPELTPVEQTLALAREEAFDGSSDSAVQFLELARTRARRGHDIASLWAVATEAERIGHVLQERGDDIAARASWGIAHDILLEFDDPRSRVTLVRLRRLLAGSPH
ncbi:serine/threonine protein kinase [Nannocystaceae bacterium ST9]